MSAIDDIVAQLPMADLAGQVGSDPQTTESAVRQVLPALLGGLQANAQDPAGAASLAGALGQHSPDLVEGGVDLDQVDPADGSKIVSNIFGGQTDQVAQTLGGSLGGETGLVQKLLPMLAPIVLSYLTNGSAARTRRRPAAADSRTSSAGCSAAQGRGRRRCGRAGRPARRAARWRSGRLVRGGLGEVLGGLLGGGRR